MKAVLTIPMAGDPMRGIGDLVEGDEAVRLCDAGFAVPFVEPKPVKEKASKPIVTEKRG